MSTNKTGTNAAEEESSESSKRTARSTRRPKQLKRPSRYKLDELEKAILSELCDDGRKAFQQIARELGVDEKTVRNRVARLRERGMLRIIPTANVNSLESCIVAMVAANIKVEARNNVEELAERLAALPMVSWVGAVLGQYDLLIEVVVQSWEELTRFEFLELSSVPGIGKTDSFLVISHYGQRGIPFVDTILASDEE